jgi:hypothetical protein
MLEEDIFCRTEYNGQEYDSRHGGAFDRGSADSWYSRPFDPHFYRGATHEGARVELKDMTVEEILAYTAGYRYNEEFGGKKDWD